MQLIVNDEIAGLHSRLARIGRRLGDTAPVMAAIGSLLEGSTRQRFADETAPDGNGWAALLPASQAGKERNRGKILTEFGDLMRSITHHAGAAAVVIGTDRHYGRYHQSGTGKMPARPFLGLSAEDRGGIDDILTQFMRGVVNG